MSISFSEGWSSHHWGDKQKGKYSCHLLLRNTLQPMTALIQWRNPKSMKQNSREKRYMYKIGTKKWFQQYIYIFFFTKKPVLFVTALRCPFILILPQDPQVSDMPVTWTGISETKYKSTTRRKGMTNTTNRQGSKGSELVIQGETDGGMKCRCWTEVEAQVRGRKWLQMEVAGSVSAGIRTRTCGEQMENGNQIT